MKRLGLGYGLRLAVSLAIVAAIVVPLAAVGSSVVQRHFQLSRLGSPDPELRERALNTLIREADDDPRWLAGVTRRLDTLPDDAFIPLVKAIQLTEVGGNAKFYAALANEYSRLSDHVFLDVSAVLRKSPSNYSNAIIAEAITRLSAAPDQPSRKPWINLLDQYQAWTTPPVPVEIYIDWLARGVEAKSPALRIQTARRLGDLPIRQPDLAPHLVAKPLRRLLEDEDADVRCAALFALAGYVQRAPDFLAELQRAAADPAPRVRPLAQRLVRWFSPDPTSPTPAAATNNDEPTPNALKPHDDWPRRLADFDAQSTASVEVVFDEAMPHHVRIAATRAARNAQPDWLRDTLRVNDRPALRDVAIFTLVQRFPPNQLEPLARELLDDHDPDARLSGAMLSGLIGRGADAIEAALPRQRRESVRILMEVALWMQGRRSDLDGQVQSLLGSKHLPESTLLLAMLHAGQQRVVLDRLLGLGEDQPLSAFTPPRRTTKLLRSERWAVVLNAYLPPTAPPLPLNATDEEFAEQLADLQAWHAIHRFD